MAAHTPDLETLDRQAKLIAQMLRKSFLSGAADSRKPAAENSRDKSGAQYVSDLLQHLPKSQRMRLLNQLRAEHPGAYRKITKAV